MRATRRSRRRCVAETLLDFFVAGGADGLGALRSACCRPTRSTRGCRRSTGASSSSTSARPRSGSRCSPVRSSIGLIAYIEHGERRRGRGSRRGFAILQRPAPARSRRDRPAGALLGAPDRLDLLLPARLPRPREHPQRAARARRRLARDALPGDPGRRRHEAGADRLPLPRPRRSPPRSCSPSASG